MAILTELKDPRVRDVTVTFVEVSADLRHAKVHVSIMGDDKKKELCLRGLKHASGYLQKKVGNRVDTRYTPRVQFVLDKGVENAMRVTRILDEVLPKDDPAEADSANTPQDHPSDHEFDREPTPRLDSSEIPDGS